MPKKKHGCCKRSLHQPQYTLDFVPVSLTSSCSLPFAANDTRRYPTGAYCDAISFSTQLTAFCYLFVSLVTHNIRDRAFSTNTHTRSAVNPGRTANSRANRMTLRRSRRFHISNRRPVDMSRSSSTVRNRTAATIGRSFSSGQ